MSRIDDLIAELCPEGVGYRPLDELCTILNGHAFKSQFFNSSGAGIPLVRIRDVNTGVAGVFYSGEYEDRYLVNNGDILIGMDGDFRVNRWSHGPGLLNQRVCRLQDFSMNVDSDFIYYYVQRELDRIHAGIQASTVKHLSSGDLKRARIPVPPLEVQREIVRILDQFTQLEAEMEAELEAELEARRRQYEHYRHYALSFSADVPRTTIGQLVEKISSGRNNLRVENGAYPVFGSTGVIGSTDQPIYTRDAILVARVGANAGRINTVSGEYDVSDNTLIMWPALAWNLRFAFHQLTDMNLNQYAVGGGQPLVTGRLLKNLDVAVPSLDEQKKIASNLDTFDTLVNDLSFGLRAELSARRKQYEYYRDRLLTFKEAAA